MHTNKGNSALIAVIILALLAGGGYMYYQGAAVEQEALQEELPAMEDNQSDPMDTGSGIVEIGAEDEMLIVPVGTESPGGDDSAMADDSGLITASPREFMVEARNFEFSVKEIRVKKGDKVRINFKSTNGFHDWVVDEFNARTAQVNTGGSSFIDFKADKTGTFEFYCSVGTHRQMGMVGKLIVE